MARICTRHLKTMLSKTMLSAGLAVAILSFGLPATASAQTSVRHVSPTFHGPQADTWYVNHYDSRYRYTCRTRHSEDQTWALWTWDNVDSGDSSIAVYIPPEEATANVTYVLTLPEQSISIPITQADHQGSWVTIHQGSHGAGRIQLRLGDANTTASGDYDWCMWGGHHSIGAAGARLTTEPGPGQGLVWVSSGDSYSSGTEALPPCRRTITSYGPAAYMILSQQRSWKIPYERFEACFGAVAGAYGEEERIWDGSDTKEYDEIHDESEGSVYHDEVDILVMSFGGNDIGFADVLQGCVLVGCLVTEDELEQRIRGLGEAMTGFYERVARDRLSERGRLYVVGYPSIVAPVEEWGFRFFGCHLLSNREGAMLERMARKLNDALKRAVQEANSQFSTTRVHYLDTLTLYRTGELNGRDYDGRANGKHELCGTPPRDGELRRTHRWMNGLVAGGLWVTWGSQSFHPNEHGHGATARALADLIADTF